MQVSYTSGISISFSQKFALLLFTLSPVELVEYIKMGSSIYEVQKGSTPAVTRAITDEDKIRHSRFITFPYTKEMEKSDPDHLQGGFI